MIFLIAAWETGLRDYKNDNIAVSVVLTFTSVKLEFFLKKLLFIEFSESEKSLEHELGPFQRSYLLLVSSCGIMLHIRFIRFKCWKPF